MKTKYPYKFPNYGRSDEYNDALAATESRAWNRFAAAALTAGHNTTAAAERADLLLGHFRERFVEKERTNASSGEQAEGERSDDHETPDPDLQAG